VIADGSPDELKRSIGGSRVDVVVRDAIDLPVAADVLEQVTGGVAELEPDLRRASAPAVDRVATLTEILVALEDAGIAVEDTGVRRPTLDEVFLSLTGQRTEVAVAA
jgi:ABC-2 type transport system ATP-binding protein